MNNLKHYIKGISTGNAYFSLSKKFLFVTTFLGIVQVIMTALYYFSGVYPLMIYSFFAALFFFILVNNLIKKESFATGSILALCLVIATAFLSTLFIGYSAGFSSYFFACIAAVFYISFVIETFQRKEMIAFMLSIIFLLCHVMNYVMMMFFSPIHELSISWTRTFHIVNNVVTFMIVICYNLLFVWELKVRNNLLSTQNEQLDEMAHKDPLTHLLNRRSMSGYLQRSMDVLRTNGKRFSLILGDIDDFKHINDTYGHDAGDLVLVTVSQILSESIRDGDVVCRWGGEEILILINDPVETASMAAERIRKRIESSVTTFEGQPIKITMTFGISESIPGYRIEQLIQQADDKLYKGKKSGKNCVVI